MIYRLLGELEIRHDGQLLDLPGGPALIVLAVLLLNANRQMSKTALIRAAWGNDEVSEAQLYKRVMAVRDLLTQIGHRDDLKTHARFGYELRVADGDADALAFTQLIREAAEAGAEHRTEDEIGCLRQALQLWRGPHPLSNVPSDAFRRDAAALEQRLKRAAVRLFELELARGNHELILDELMLIAGYYPDDRRLSEQLMIAQYWCGHLADVSRVYERYRDALAEETGAQPDPLLRNLHFAIGLGDEEATAAAEAALTKRAGTPARPIVTVPRQLPRPVDLVGRDALAAEVSWLLGSEPGPAMPVVVISGPGGIGKTALALRAAHESSDRYPDGQLYLELRGTIGGAVDTGEALAQFLRALGVPRVPETTGERLAQYRTLLADRRVLVVLDDAASGAQVSQLVPASPRCAVLVTARQRLPEISGAHHGAPLGPLDPAEATELFLRVVRDAGISLEADLDAVGQVVALCGGLPLALRIAGALRVHDHPRPTRELASRLARQGHEALTYGELSVSRTIGAGFDRLGSGARALFLELGLLPLTGFGLWTAAALLDGTGADAATELSQLAASFMIESVESQLRYRFHDLTRDYARHRAESEYPGDRGAVPARAYRALLTLARRAHARLYGGDFEVVHGTVPDWDAPAEVLAEVDAGPLDWFEKERSNIRAAVGHCAALGLTEMCWDLAVSAHEFYTVRGYFDDWYATHTLALEACRKADDRRGEGIVLACLNQPALVASRRLGVSAGLPTCSGQPACWPSAPTSTARPSPCARSPTRCAGKAISPGRWSCFATRSSFMRPAATPWAGGRPCGSSGRPILTSATTRTHAACSKRRRPLPADSAVPARSRKPNTGPARPASKPATSTAPGPRSARSLPSTVTTPASRTDTPCTGWATWRCAPAPTAWPSGPSPKPPAWPATERTRFSRAACCCPPPRCTRHRDSRTSRSWPWSRPWPSSPGVAWSTSRRRLLPRSPASRPLAATPRAPTRHGPGWRAATKRRACPRKTASTAAPIVSARLHRCASAAG